MTKRSLNAYAVRTDPGKPVTWLASTPNKLEADGMRIPIDAWDLTDFDKRGRPLLYGHEYQRPPIGRVTKIEKTPRGLIAESIFDERDPFAAEIARKVREGWLNCCSVGFQVLDRKGDTITRASLLELSVTPISADPDAVVLARSAYRSLSAPRRPTRPMSDEAALRALHKVIVDGHERMVLRPQVERILGDVLREKGLI